MAPVQLVNALIVKTKMKTIAADVISSTVYGTITLKRKLAMRYCKFLGENHKANETLQVLQMNEILEDIVRRTISVVKS